LPNKKINAPKAGETVPESEDLTRQQQQQQQRQQPTHPARAKGNYLYPSLGEHFAACERAPLLREHQLDPRAGVCVFALVILALVYSTLIQILAIGI